MTITKSGELASFYTVNKAPIKHLRVYFSPKQAGSGDPSPENVREISGWNGVEVTQCGVNIFDRNNFIQKSYYFAPTTITGDSRSKTAIIPCTSNTTYTIYKPPTKNDRFAVGCSDHICEVGETLTKGTSDTAYVSNVGWTSVNHKIVFTTDSTAKYLYIRYRNGFTSSDLGYATNTEMLEHILGGMQVEIGENEKSYDEYEYKPYVGSTQTVDWSNIGTIYGGYVDLITGEVSQTWKKVDWNDIVYEGQNTTSGSYVVKYVQSGGKSDTTLNSHFSANLPYGSINRFAYIGSSLYYALQENLLENATIESAKKWLIDNNVTSIFQLYTPITYQLTPQQLETFLGRNNIWSNADRVEIEYDLAESNDILYRRRNVLEKGYPHIVTPEANSIVTFNTDLKAPLKQCKIYFNPIQEGSGDPSPDNVREIIGQNNIQIFQSKKNLYANGDQVVTTASPFIYKSLVNPLLPGTYTFSAVVTSTDTNADTCLIRFFKEDGKNPNTTGPDIIQYQILRSTNNSRVNFTFTINDTAYWMYLYASNTYNNGKNDTAQFTDIMIEATDTMTEYEPYNGQILSIPLPSTLYGGYIDLVKGEIVKTFGIVDLGYQGWVASTNNRFNAAVDGGKLPSTAQGSGIGWCETYKVVQKPYGELQDKEMLTGFFSYGSQYYCIVVKDTNYSTLEEFKAGVKGLHFVYELNTPIHYSIDPITLKTLRGINNIWSTANGNIEIQYYTH